MKCVIQYIRPLRNKIEVITLNEEKIFFDDGRYEKMILNNKKLSEKIYSRLYEIAFSWKQEYIGNKVYDGEKYLIEFDINHKKKKYKIQNKFPENWDEFLMLKNEILELSGD